MEKSKYYYVMARFQVKWDIVEREVNVSDSVYRKTL